MSFDLDRAHFEDWLARYRRAWEERDPAQAGALFTENAVYAETPFNPPMRGRSEIESYWADAVSRQKDVRFSSEVLACNGNQGLCRWHVALTSVPEGSAVELDGIFRCLFADNGLVETFQEWWHVKA